MHENYTSEGRYVPKDLQDKYTDIRLEKSDAYGGEQLFGVKKGTSELEPIDWAVVIDPVEDQYGVLAPRWSDEDLENYKNNPELWRAHKENAFLRSEVERQARKIERHDSEMSGLRNEVNELKEQVRELRERRPGVAAANTPEAPATRVRSRASAPASPTNATVGTTPPRDDVTRREPPRADRVAPPAQPLAGSRGASATVNVPADEHRDRGRVSNWWNRPGGARDTLAGRKVLVSYAVRNGERVGEPVVVEDDEVEYVESDRKTIVAAAVGGTILAGLLGYWIGRHFGPDHASGINEIISQNNTIKGQNSHLLNEVDSLKDQLSSVSRKAQQIPDIKRTVHANHNLLVDLKHHEAREAASGIGTTPTGGRGFEFPWNWAKDQYGTNRAERMLHVLGERAIHHGHSVKWFLHGFLPNGARREIMMVDGTTNTQSVIGVISQYK